MPNREVGTLLSWILRFMRVAAVFTSLLCLASVAHAYEALGGRFLAEATAGAGYMPLDEWTDFWGQMGHSHMQKDRLASYYDLSLTYVVRDRHAIKIGLGRIATTTSVYFVSIETSATGEPIGHLASDVIEHEISATALSASYEVIALGSDARVVPYMGLGLSYMFSEVDAQMTDLYSSTELPPARSDTREEQGYGIHAYIGLRSYLSKTMFVATRLRARYADGSELTDEEGSIALEFTGVDLGLGAGWRF